MANPDLMEKMDYLQVISRRNDKSEGDQSGESSEGDDGGEENSVIVACGGTR